MITKLLLRILEKLHLLQYLNVTIPYTRQGQRVKIPVLKSLGLGNLTLSELWMCDLIEKLLILKKGAFIDLGVNLGQTLIKLKLVDNECFYVGFDPNPLCIYYTNELIKSNAYANAVLVPVGLAAKTELVNLNFYSDSDSDSSASIIDNFRPHQVYQKKFAPCFNYVDVKHAFPASPAAIVKIDVEGAELEVLSGLRPFLDEQRPFVVIEILPSYDIKNARWKRQQLVERLIREMNYKIFQVVHGRETLKGMRSIKTIGINANVQSSDYFLCPAENVASLNFPMIVDPDALTET